MNAMYAESADLVAMNDCRNARFTSTPPKAPMAPAKPISAPACRCDFAIDVAGSAPLMISVPDLDLKMAGIILYTEPLPRPLKANSMTKPMRYSGSDWVLDAISTIDAPSAIATKLTNDTLDPPNLSASEPPTGRISEPISGPMKVRYAAFTGVEKMSANCTCSTW